MAQTAVEWYAKEHYSLLIRLNNEELRLSEYIKKHRNILRQAKQMEKEQIIKAYSTVDKYVRVSTRKEAAEQYYNETYGKDSNEPNA